MCIDLCCMGTLFGSHYMPYNYSFSNFFVYFGIIHSGCLRRNGQNFGRVFLMLKYTDITQDTYIQS